MLINLFSVVSSVRNVTNIFIFTTVSASNYILSIPKNYTHTYYEQML